MQQPQQQQQQQQQQQPPQLQPGALQQAPGDDGSLYAPPELQSSATFQQQQHQHQHQHQQHYAALGASPQPLHFDEHYASFPPAYPQAASPSFALTGGLHTPRVPQRQLHHISPLQPTPPQHDHASQSYTQVSPQTQPPQISPQDKSPFANHGQFPDLKLIPNPPNLDLWRERLFDVDEMITLSQDEFQTYFPHIDNVYSHRSTQRHKRHRMVSHYWDCRLKGRPPGTKKSTDPDKKKRKRVARERDLCDVKIKITEFKNIAEYDDLMGHMPPRCSLAGTEFSTYTRRPVQDAITAHSEQQSTFFQPTQMLAQQSLASWDMPPNLGQEDVNMASFDQPPPPLTKSPQRKYYTIQRVNGNGGNGKSDGAAGPHKHSLEESDRVKKNSVVRWLAKIDKERKKSQGGDASKKTYHKKATGNALTTVKNHSKEDDLKLYGSCFCPFVQRVWISLEHKKIPYQYIEVDPYKKPQSLLDVNPRGLVPAIRHGPTWSTHESTVIMEYLEDLNTGPALLPGDAQTRATSRLWSDHVNRHIIPVFYKLLQAQDTNDQVTHATELRDQINKLVSAADAEGPFFLGRDMSFVDVQIAPWMIRLRRVLGPYRGWPEAEEGSRWRTWVDAIDNERSVKMTTSTDELYLDSYERYAENRPGTSQLADAVNSGRGLP